MCLPIIYLQAPLRCASRTLLGLGVASASLAGARLPGGSSKTGENKETPVGNRVGSQPGSIAVVSIGEPHCGALRAPCSGTTDGASRLTWQEQDPTGDWQELESGRKLKKCARRIFFLHQTTKKALKNFVFVRLSSYFMCELVRERAFECALD